MTAQEAADRWRTGWEQAWPRHDVEAIAALYAPTATYRALVFRPPDEGTDGVRRYLRETFAEERDVECRFGVPISAGNRAAVEWWASWIEGGEEVTLAGTTLLAFDDSGQVVDHRDHWNQQPGRVQPFAGW